MKKLFLLFVLCVSVSIKAQENLGDTTLLIIDVQYFYYPGGKVELVNPEAAGKNARKLLDAFRKKNKTIVHIKHNFEPGGDIHEDVKPIQNEKIIVKNYPNSFKGTDLESFLTKHKVKTLIICGMQTHMCVEAATRAASDMGFKCIVIHDACATRNLEFDKKEINAEEVHLSTLASLKTYAQIVSTSEFLQAFKSAKKE